MKKSVLITAIALSAALTACTNGALTDSGSSRSAANTSSSEGVAGITAANPPSQVQSGSDYSYKKEDGGIEITGSSITAGNVVIPDEIEGKRVIAISGNPDTPMFPKAKTVTLPETLEEIDDYAFANCASLTKITVPASVEDIDDYAFMNCAALTSITFSNGLKSIGDGAFSGCISLTKINLPDTIRSLEPTAFDTNVDFTVTYKGSSYTPANINELYRILMG